MRKDLRQGEECSQIGGWSTTTILLPYNMPVPPPIKRVTLGDLARELGVSDRAVSQALNPRESNVKLNPKTVERIKKLALQKNYRPDSRARSMRYGRFCNIGYFEAKQTANAWPLLGAESGVFDAASEKQYRVVLIRLPSNVGKDQISIPSTFREGNLDAMILSHAGNVTPELEEVIDASGFPVVYLNEKKRHNAVYSDDRGGAEAITQHLIGLGKKRIVYVGNSVRLPRPGISEEPHYSVRDRLLGYKTAMERAGLRAVIGHAFDVKPASGTSDLLGLLRVPGKVDAIVTYSDFIALGVFRLLFQNRIDSRDLPITGFGNDFAIDCYPLGLTTMKTPFYDMGRAAVDMALALVSSGKKTIPAQVFPVELIARESTLGVMDSSASLSGK